MDSTTTSTSTLAPSSTITLLGKKYSITYPKNSAQDLEKAAELLNNKMQEAQKLGKYYDSEQAAIVAGLNIAHELLTMIDQINQEEPEPMINENIHSINSLPEDNLELEEDTIEYEEYNELDYDDDDDDTDEYDNDEDYDDEYDEDDEDEDDEDEDDEDEDDEDYDDEEDDDLEELDLEDIERNDRF